MDDMVRLSLLFDFYGELLKPAQKDIFNSFVFDDLSLSEIADEQGISRQAVHEKVKRCIVTLEDYEKRLGLIARYNEVCNKADSLKAIIASLDIPKGDLERINGLIEDIVEV